MAGLFFRLHHLHHKIIGIASAAASAALFCSCSAVGNTASSQSFVFDTYSQVTVCGSDSEDVLSEVESILSEMSAGFELCYDMTAAELPQNRLYSDCLSKTHELNRRYGNGINVFCGKLTKLWGISAESPKVPADEEIAAAGIQAMEHFYHSIGMPVNLDELGVHPTDVQIEEMVDRCIAASGNRTGSAKKLSREDMVRIFTNACRPR